MTPSVLFKCLADETRLRCLALLHKEGKLCVCELTYALDMLQPKISRHLAQLRQCGLLLDSREGQWVYYQINPNLPTWVQEVIASSAKEMAIEQSQDGKRLQAMPGRPEMKACCG